MSIVAAFCAVSGTAWAQRANGPYADMFNRTSNKDGDSLQIRWNMAGGYDDLVLDEAKAYVEATNDPRFRASGDFSWLSADLSYQHRKGKARIGLYASASAREYIGLHETTPLYATGASFAVPIARGTTIRAGVNASYASFTQFVPFLSDPGADFALTPPTFDFAATPFDSFSAGVDVGVSQQFSPRSSLSVDASIRRTSLTNAGVDEGHFEGRSIFAAYQHGVTKNLGFHARLGHQEGLFPWYLGGRSPMVENLDVGIDFNKPLSISRSTSLSISTGSALLRGQYGDSQYRLTGGATLQQAIGRSWSAFGGFSRGFQLLYGMTDIVFSDSLTVGLNGLVTTRVQTSVSVSSTSGTVGISDAAPHFDAYSATAHASIAITRKVALTTDYVYYRYATPVQATPAGLYAPFGRQSLFIGLSGWIPLIQDNVGRGRDSR